MLFRISMSHSYTCSVPNNTSLSILSFRALKFSHLISNESNEYHFAKYIFTSNCCEFHFVLIKRHRQPTKTIGYIPWRSQLIPPYLMQCQKKSVKTCWSIQSVTLLKKAAFFKFCWNPFVMDTELLLVFVLYDGLFSSSYVWLTL